MNLLRTLLILSLISCAVSCSKEPEPAPVVEAKPTAPPQKPPPATAGAPSARTTQAQPQAPAPAVPAGQKQPPTVARHLAPEGVFYLTQRVSLTTDSGIVGYPPGTVVTLISKEGSTSKVKTGDGADLSVPDNVLTNDMDVAARVLKSDNRAQTDAAAAAQRDRVSAEQRHIQELEAESKKKGPKP